MSIKGATSTNFQVVADVKSGAGGKAQQHDLRAIGFEKSEVEKLMKEHFGEFDMINMPKEQRKEINQRFLDALHQKMEEKGIIDMKSDDPDDRKVMNHVDPELTPLNEFIIVKPLEIYLEEELMPLVKEKTHRGVQGNCTPFKEDLLNTNKDTTMDDLVKYCNAIHEEFGWTAVQIYMHHDEGHFDDQTGEWKENYHAHIIFDTISHDTGKTIQMNRFDTARRQSIAAESLGMLRGENSSDVGHTDSLQYKEEQKLSDSRFKMSLSVKNVGIDPVVLMVDDIKKKIEDVSSSNRAKEPNNRTVFNLIRPIAKCLNLNPTKRCADAIYAGLQRNPDKIHYVAKELEVKECYGNGVQKPMDVLDDEVKNAIYRKAVWCGKINEDAKAFRPLLHCAKELGVDLVPVVLNPVKETLDKIPSLPMDKDTNNRLWRAIESYKKGKPLEMLENAQKRGLDALKSQADEAIQIKDEVFADMDKNISDTLEIVGSSKADVLKDGIHHAIEEVQKDKDAITQPMVRSLAKLCGEIGLRPSEIIAQKMDDHMSDRGRQWACDRFGLPEDTDRKQVCNTAFALAKQYDDKKDYSSNNLVICHFKSPYGYERLAENLLKQVDSIADKSKSDSKMMEKLEIVSDHFNVDFMQEVKRAVENGEQTIKEKVTSHKKVLEGAKKALETQNKALGDAKDAMDEIEIRIADKRLEEAELDSHISTLNEELAEKEKELGKEPKDRSMIEAVMDAANKGFRALGDLLEGKKEKDVKEVICELVADNNKLNKQLVLLSGKKDIVDVAKKRDEKAVKMKETSERVIQNAMEQVDSVTLQANLVESEASVKDLKKQVDTLTEEKQSMLSANKDLSDILVSMLPSQPKAIQVVCQTKGFTLKNILDAIKDKVIKCFTGELTHPDFKNDPFKVEGKDIIIKDGCLEPLINDVPLVQIAMEMHRENVQKSQSEEQKQSQNRGPKL